MGANSFRKRVFQGPLTLGLHSTTFRSALPSATLPYPRKFLNRAKPRTCSFRFLLFPSVTTDVCFTRVLSQVFTCSGTRTGSMTAQTAHLPFSLFFVSVGYYRHSFFAGALTGFHLFGYPRKPRTCFLSLSSFPSVKTDVCF